MSDNCAYCPRTFEKPEDKFRHMVKDHADAYKADLSPEGWERQKAKFG